MQILEHPSMQWPYEVSLWPCDPIQHNINLKWMKKIVILVSSFFFSSFLGCLKRMAREPKKVPTVFHMPTKYCSSPLVAFLPVLIP